MELTFITLVSFSPTPERVWLLRRGLEEETLDG